MPGTDGLTALPAILAEFPAVRVLMLTTYDVDEYVLAALRGGAAISSRRLGDISVLLGEANFERLRRASRCRVKDRRKA